MYVMKTYIVGALLRNELIEHPANHDASGTGSRLCVLASLTSIAGLTSGHTAVEMQYLRAAAGSKWWSCGGQCGDM